MPNLLKIFFPSSKPVWAVFSNVINSGRHWCKKIRFHRLSSHIRNLLTWLCTLQSCFRRPRAQICISGMYALFQSSQKDGVCLFGWPVSTQPELCIFFCHFQSGQYKRGARCSLLRLEKQHAHGLITPLCAQSAALDFISVWRRQLNVVCQTPIVSIIN